MSDHAILSENSIEHCCWPSVALLRGHSSIARCRRPTAGQRDYDKLRHVLARLRWPGFRQHTRYVKPPSRPPWRPDVEVVLASGQLGRSTTAFADLLATEPTPATWTRPCTPRTQAPSPSSCSPPVRPRTLRSSNTHRMWCANQQQLIDSDPGAGRASAGADRLAALEPHLAAIIKSWASVAKRRHALHRRWCSPPALIGETLRNLREIAPTVYLQRAHRKLRPSPTRWRPTKCCAATRCR